MSAFRSPEEKAARKLRRFLIGLGVFCTVMGSIHVVPSILIRQTASVTITSVDAARECRSRRNYKIWPKYRSGVPQSSFGYCGLIMSDHGSFELPETTWFSLFGVSRENLFDGLVEGCRYRIVVSGPGLALAEGRAMSNLNRTLRSLEALGDCISSDNV